MPVSELDLLDPSHRVRIPEPKSPLWSFLWETSRGRKFSVKTCSPHTFWPLGQSLRVKFARFSEKNFRASTKTDENDLTQSYTIRWNLFVFLSSYFGGNQSVAKLLSGEECGWTVFCRVIDSKVFPQKGCCQPAAFFQNYRRRREIVTRRSRQTNHGSCSITAITQIPPQLTM